MKRDLLYVDDEPDNIVVFEAAFEDDFRILSVLIRAFQAHDLSLANSALTDQLVLSERLALLGQATARLAHEMGNHLCLLPLVEYIEDHCQNDHEMLKLAQLT